MMGQQSRVGDTGDIATLHQDAAVDVEDHDHAQGSAAVFAAEACLLSLRLWSHAAAKPEGPAAMQPHEPLRAIECRP